LEGQFKVYATGSSRWRTTNILAILPNSGNLPIRLHHEVVIRHSNKVTMKATKGMMDMIKVIMDTVMKATDKRKPIRTDIQINTTMEANKVTTTLDLEHNHLPLVVDVGQGRILVNDRRHASVHRRASTRIMAMAGAHPESNNTVNTAMLGADNIRKLLQENLASHEGGDLKASRDPTIQVGVITDRAMTNFIIKDMIKTMIKGMTSLTRKVMDMAMTKTTIMATTRAANHKARRKNSAAHHNEDQVIINFKPEDLRIWVRITRIRQLVRMEIKQT
jgi:hypothetical protein